MCGANSCEKPDCTWSQSHRQKTEAQDVAKRYRKSGANAVKEYLSLVAKNRGQQAADVLRADALRILGK